MPTVLAFQIESGDFSRIVLASEVVAHGGVYYFYNGSQLIEDIPFVQLLRPPVPIYGLTDHEKTDLSTESDEEIDGAEHEGKLPEGDSPPPVTP